jgi:hypothetical protein
LASERASANESHTFAREGWGEDGEEGEDEGGIAGVAFGGDCDCGCDCDASLPILCSGLMLVRLISASRSSAEVVMNDDSQGARFSEVDSSSRASGGGSAGSAFIPVPAVGLLLIAASRSSAEVVMNDDSQGARFSEVDSSSRASGRLSPPPSSRGGSAGSASASTPSSA